MQKRKELIAHQIETLFQSPTSLRIMLKKTQTQKPALAQQVQIFFLKDLSSQFMRLLSCHRGLTTRHFSSLNLYLSDDRPAFLFSDS